MNEEIYMQTQCSLLVLATMCAGLDLGTFLEVLDRAETVGPSAEPAAYRRGARALQLVRALATAAADFVERTRPVVEELREAGLDVGGLLGGEVGEDELEPAIRRLMVDLSELADEAADPEMEAELEELAELLARREAGGVEAEPVTSGE